MWDIIARTVLRNRVFILVLIGGITAFMLYKASFLQMSYEYTQVLPKKDSAYIKYDNFKKIFGEEANIMVIGFKDDDFFKLKKFTDWYKLGNYIKTIDGVTGVASIAHNVTLLKDTIEKKFIVVPLFKEIPKTQSQLDSILNIAFSLPFYKNLLYNKESNVQLMAITFSKEKLDSKYRDDIIRDITQQVDKFSKKYKIETHLSGMPYIRTTITNIVKSEIYLFIILSILLMSFIIYFFYRSFRVVFVSFCLIIISVIWTLGTIVLMGFKVSMLTGLIPSVIVVISIPYSVYMHNKYLFEYKKHGNKIKALQRAISRNVTALLFSNLSTAVGFATSIFTTSIVLKEFGKVASVNVIGILILSLCFIPIILSYLPEPKTKHVKHFDNKYFRSVIESIITIITHHRYKTYVLTVFILMLGIIGITLMKSTGYIVDDIPKKHPLYVDLKFFEKHFNGVLPLEISIDTKKRNGMAKLSNIKKVEQLQDSLKKYNALSRPLSFNEAIKFAKQAFYNGNPNFYTLPSEGEKTFILSYVKNNKSQENNKLLNSFLDSTRQITRISVQMADIGNYEIEKLTKNIQADIDSIFPATQFKTCITGSCVIFSKGTEYLLNNLIIGSVLAIILISMFLIFSFLSFRMLLIALIPNLIPLFLTAAIMGFSQITIKPSSMLVFSIAFGISVDNAIQILVKFKQELLQTKWDIKESLYKTIRETGVGLLYTAVTLTFGFGIFFLSQFGGTKALGFLIAFTLFISIFANMILLPSIILSLEKKLIISTFNQKTLVEDDEDTTENSNEVKTQCIKNTTPIETPII